MSCPRLDCIAGGWILTKMEIAYTVHARDMLTERAIPDAWIVRAVESPQRTENHDDGTTHYLSKVPERSGRVLRVVMNTEASPPIVVTVFFDRRLRRQS
jgi:hypothetical protein